VKRFLVILCAALIVAGAMAQQTDKRKPWRMFDPTNLYTKGVPVRVLWTVSAAGDTLTGYFLVSADGDTLLSATSDYLVLP
jgi:hypothetical protein